MLSEGQNNTAPKVDGRFIIEWVGNKATHRLEGTIDAAQLIYMLEMVKTAILGNQIAQQVQQQASQGIMMAPPGMKIPK